MRRSILIVSASMGAGHDGAARELERRLVARGHDVRVVDYLKMVPLRLGGFVRWSYLFQLQKLAVDVRPHLSGLQQRLRRGHVGTGRACREPAHSTAAASRAREATAPTRSCPPIRSRRSCSAACAQEALAARARRHVPHRLRRAPALGAPRHRPPPRGERDVGRHGSQARWPRQRARAARSSATGSATPSLTATTCAPASASSRTSVRCSSSPVRGASATCRRPSRRSRGADREFHPITVCGQDDKLRASLLERGLGGTVLGWTDEMPALMAAADALVENAGGLDAHGGVRRRAPRDLVPADRRARQGQREVHGTCRVSAATRTMPTSCATPCATRRRRARRATR